MVTDSVLIRNKHRVLKKTIKILIILFLIVFILLIFFVAGFSFKKTAYVEVHIVNPLANLVLKYTDSNGVTNKTALVEEAVIEFNQDYINYILAALGTGYLHKSILGENPSIELNLDDEVWSAEIIEGMPNSMKKETLDEDLKVSLSKTEAVEAILSPDIRQFMKSSVSEGNTQIEMVAGKAELFSKGYLAMYQELTGEDISLE